VLPAVRRKKTLSVFAMPMRKLPKLSATTIQFLEAQRETNNQTAIRVLFVLFWIFIPAAAFSQEAFGIIYFRFSMDPFDVPDRIG